MGQAVKLSTVLGILLTLLATMPTAVLAAAPLAGKKFVVDAGHGGWDPGAKGPTGLTEKSVNLRVATSLRNILTEYGGATVKLTRTDDRFLTLKQRAQIANNWGADRFISIHHNGSTNKWANGTEVYSHTRNNKTSNDLRNKVQARLVKTTKLPNFGAKTANFAVLRQTWMPAILTEASFITNPYEEARLKNPEYVWRQAYAIYQGIVDHMGKK
ncbi:MAG TPA: N-acetylmuramoyl-L-alanine amidase [Firmicutes bacterium]|nr:N-acetylmuramoyl-L-alanine amidase [Bacillota bacterium]